MKITFNLIYTACKTIRLRTPPTINSMLMSFSRWTPYRISLFRRFRVANTSRQWKCPEDHFTDDAHKDCGRGSPPLPWQQSTMLSWQQCTLEWKNGRTNECIHPSDPKCIRDPRYDVIRTNQTKEKNTLQQWRRLAPKIKLLKYPITLICVKTNDTQKRTQGEIHLHCDDHPCDHRTECHQRDWEIRTETDPWFWRWSIFENWKL